MADENGNSTNDSGSKDRATVALVDAKVDGLRELIRAEFANVKEDVRALAAVASDLIKQGIQIDDHDRRLTKLETEKTSEREYRRIHLPAIVLASIAALTAIVGLITQFLGGVT